MNPLSFLRLVQNAALLLSLVLVFDVFALRWRAGQHAFSRNRLIAGLIIGGIGVVVMLTPWVLMPGLVFDTRSVLLSISGLFFGTAPTLIAMLITAALRLYQGGPGIWPGVSTVLVTGSLGLIWRRVYRGKLEELKLPELYLFGLVTHLIMLLLMFTLPLEMALHTLRNISAPVLIVYPLASTLLGGLMVNRLRRERLIDERQHAEEALRAERQLLRTLIDNLPDAIYAKDAQGRKTLANRTDLNNIGLPEEKVLGKTDAELFPSEIAASFMADDAVVLETGVPVLNREELLFNIQGKQLWQLTSKLPLRDADGQIVGLVGIGRNITESKQAEEALRAERDLVRRIMETSPAGIIMANTTGQIVFANPQAEQVLGLSRDQIHRRTYDDPAWHITDYNGEPFPEDELPFAQVQRTLRPVNDVRHAIEWSDGRRVLLKINAAPVLNEDGAFNGIIATVEDVTAQVQAQEQLLMMQFAMEQAAIEVFWINEDGRFLYVNKRACEALGYTREQLMAMAVSDIDPSFSVEHWKHHWREVQQNNTFTVESYHRASDGHVAPVEITVNYLEYNGKEYNFAFAVDITARRQAERALQASEAWLRSFVDSMDDAIFSLDAEQRHTAIYGQWVERLGMIEEQFLGRTASAVFGPEAARVHETANIQALTTGSSVTYEWEVNGHHFQTTLSPLHGPDAEIVGLVGVGRDITALKNYHARLQSALDEKTLLLSEIHHRIKNNLQVILGLLELQFATVVDEGTQQMLRESQNRIKAIALIHEQLYQTPGQAQVNARLYIQSLTRYLTQTYNAMVRGIVVEQDIADLKLDIDLAIPCALIISELISNALKYAFPPEWKSPDGAPPTLRVALQHTGAQARLAVADNGVGLPEGIDLETSTRLGLRLIKMLARQIDGELSVEQDGGTCIAITFAWSEG